jgi:transmembrane protein DUF3566
VCPAAAPHAKKGHVGEGMSVAKSLETQPPADETHPFRPPVTPKRARVVVRKVGPWSVLKFSLLFYFCVMLVVLFALYLLFGIMRALGTLDAIVDLLEDLTLVEKGFVLDTGWIFVRLFWFGVALAVLWSIINLFAAVLYNLISDVVGGVEITLGEKH